MKSLVVTALLLAAGLSLNAQTPDTTRPATDTMRVGNFVIVKDNKADTTKEDRSAFRIRFRMRNHKQDNVTTNWLGFDLGFANWRDNTAYGSAEANDFMRPGAGQQPFIRDDLKLRTGKTSNVNIWLFMQKRNLVKHVLNLKYGIGLEMYNFRYSTNISYHSNPTYIFRDSVSFSKNKLYVGYLTVPLMFNFNTKPGYSNGLNFSFGASASYRVGGHTKQVSEDRGKEKVKGDLSLETFKFAGVAEIGFGPINLYGTYSFTKLSERGLQQYPYAFGIRLGGF
jgi:hypothetical protein